MSEEKAKAKVADPFEALTQAKLRQSVTHAEEVLGKTKKGFGFANFDPPLLKAISAKGYTNPTPIQKKAIPEVIAGHDVVAMARTGSGKSASFLIPIIQRLKEHKQTIGARALVLSPTRELALQTLSFCTALSKFTDLRTCLIVGGDSLEYQFSALVTNPDIIIATPGRLRHLLDEVETFSLREIQMVVFDEGDRLYEQGLADDMKYLMEQIPTPRQVLIFSATLPHLLASFAQVGLVNPVIIRLDVEHQLSEKLDNHFFRIRGKEKDAGIVYLLREIVPAAKRTLVFFSTRHHVEYFQAIYTALFGENSSVAIYGKMDQSARKIALAKFSKGKCNVLFVTDLAARGIDIPILDYVINYDFTDKAKLFVHRVGRVARANRSGIAFSMLDGTEMAYMFDLMLFLGRGVDETTCGVLPESLLDHYQGQIQQLHQREAEFDQLHKSMQNASSLYKRTRQPASNASAIRAKEFGSNLKLHPLFAAKLGDGADERISYVNRLKEFRPPQTVFEMKGLKRSEATALDVPGLPSMPSINAQNRAAMIMKKKRMKHDRIIASASSSNSEGIQSYEPPPSRVAESIPDSIDKSASFRDDAFYIGGQKKNYYKEKGLELGSTQGAATIESMMLDVVPEDAKDIFRKRTAMQWDRKRKKYVLQTGGMDHQAALRGTIKTENGRRVSKKDMKVGKTYQKWAQKNNQELAKVGELEVNSSKQDYNHCAHFKEVKKVGTRRFKSGFSLGPPAASGNELKSATQIAKTRSENAKKAAKEYQRDNKRKRGNSDAGEAPKKRRRINGNRQR